MKDALRGIKRRLILTYFTVRNWWPIWYYILNRCGRRLAAKYSKLSAKENEIAAAFLRDGIVISHISRFFSDDFTAALKNQAKKLENFPEAPEVKGPYDKGAHKTFLTKLWGGYGAKLSKRDLESNFLIKLALNDEMLKIASSYLGACPKLFNFDLRRTIIVSSGEGPRFSQRWHRDPEDKKMVKVFLYLSDVDEEGAGPFKYVLGSQPKGKWSKFYPQRPPAGTYPPEGVLEKAIPESDVLTCFGKAGTLIFCDTTGFHKGGFSTTRERLMLTITFVSEASIVQRYFTFSDDVKSLSIASPLARFALNL